MRISKAVIHHFGKFKNFNICFSKGLNVVYGSNEAGKSTIVAFIKAILYGIHTQKKNIRDNDRKRYMPWSGETASGELQLVSDQLIYHIKRSFGERKSKDKIEIFNGVSGEEIVFENMDKPGKHLFGVEDSTFEKTTLIRQLSNEITKEGSDEIQKYLTNLQGSGDASVSYNQAKKVVEDYRKEIVNTTRKPGVLDRLKEEYHQNHEKLNVLINAKQELERREANDGVSLNEEIDKVLSIKDIPEVEAESIKAKRMKQKSIRDMLLKKTAEREATEKELEAISKMSELLSMDHVKANEDFRKIIEENIRIEGYSEKIRKTEAIHKEIAQLKEDKERIKTVDLKKMEYAIEEAEGIIERIEDLEKQHRNRNADQEFSLRRNSSRMAAVIFSFMFIFVLVWAIMTQILPVPVSFIFLLPVYYFYRRSRILSGQLYHFSMEKQKTFDEIQRLEKRLIEIYRAHEVNNIREAREKYQKIRTQYDRINTILFEKERLFQEYDDENNQDQLNRSNAYISLILEKYQCENKTQLQGKIEKSEEIKIKAGQYTDKIQSIKKDEEELSNEIRFLEKDILEEILTAYENAVELLRSKTVVLQKRITLYEKEMKAVDEALDALNQAFQKFHMEFGSKLNISASKILKRITLSGYEDMMISKDFDVKVSEKEGNDIHHVEYLSNGTWDQIYFSVRMGISELIFQKIRKSIPIILDDTFVQYDQLRMGAVLDYLYECSKTNQILLFTCHKREVEYLNKYEDVNVITF